MINLLKYYSHFYSGSKIIFASVLLFMFSMNVSAQELTASASPATVAVGDQVHVTFALNANGSNFHAPTFTDFNVLLGPSQSTSMQIINGSVSQTISFTYILQAMKEGTFK